MYDTFQSMVTRGLNLFRLDTLSLDGAGDTYGTTYERQSNFHTNQVDLEIEQWVGL